MTVKFTSFTQTLGGAAALLAFASLPLMAHASDSASTARSQAPADSHNMTVVIDAVTGQLRAPTTEELRAAAARAPATRASTARTMPKVSSTGARGARLTDEFMSYTVAVRQPDGSLAEVCYDTKEEADAAQKQAAVGSKNSLPTE